MLSAQVVWANSIAAVKKELSETSFKAWFESIRPIVIDNDILVLETNGKIEKETLNNLYRESIAKIVNAANDIDIKIIYIDPSEHEKYAVEEVEEDSNDSYLNLNPKYTFETFVIGSSNHLAHAASLAVAENPARAYNPLFMYGGVGLGKTHLMHAIAHRIKQNNPKAKIMYVTSETFLNELVESIKENKNSQFRSKYRTVDVLLIDDIQFITGKEGMQEEFFHTFNTLHSANKQIIISSDKPPKDIPTLEERLRSRFEGGLIVDIQQPDLETRTAILRKKTLSEGYEVSNDILLFIAEKVNSNIRELEGSLTRVVAYANLMKVPVSISIAELALRDLINGKQQKMVTIDSIQQVVADTYGITVDDIKSKRRSRDVAYPRQIAMYLCRTILDCSYPQIGEAFGGRDHTTIMYAQEKVSNDIKTNVKIEAEIRDIINRIKE